MCWSIPVQTISKNAFRCAWFVQQKQNIIPISFPNQVNALYDSMKVSVCIYEIASGKHETCLLHWDQSERHIYLFLLSPQGHCFHGDSLMASFASLFLIFFFTPLPSYLQYLCLKTPHDRCGSGPPSSPHPPSFPTHRSSLFHPYLPLPQAVLFERPKWKRQSVNRLRERQCSDGL